MSITAILVIALLLAFMGYTFDIMNRMYVDIKFIKLQVDHTGGAHTTPNTNSNT